MTPLEVLRSLGDGEPPPARAKQRVYDAVIAAVGAANVDAPLSRQPQQPTLDSQPTRMNGLLGRAVEAKAAVFASGIFLLGATAGALLYGVIRPPEVRVVYVERPIAAAKTPPAPIASVDPAPTVASAPERASAPLNAHLTKGEPVQGTAQHAASDLARERALLDAARASAARGEPADALAQVARHRQQFPRGRLSEEREALAIRALLSLGRRREAGVRMNAFRAAFPNSFLAPALEAAASAP